MSDTEYPNECRHCHSPKTKVGQTWISNQIGYHYFVICEECLMRGPLQISRESATKTWNELPKCKTADEVFENDALAKAVFGLVFTPENTVDICKKIVSIMEYYRK